MLTREQILRQAPERREVDVPEWGDKVRIQALTVAAAQSLTAEDGIVDLVIASCINEDGTPMFSPEDKDSLRRLGFAALKRIADAAVAFNAISAPAVEALVKNSETTPNGASSSD